LPEHLAKTAERYGTQGKQRAFFVLYAEYFRSHPDRKLLDIYPEPHCGEVMSKLMDDHD
jgi:hypothetical protein